MMAAAKKGTLKKKRSAPTRTRRPDPDSSAPPPETRRSLRPRQTRYLADLEDELDLEEEEERERESKERRKLKLVLKLPPISTGRCRDSIPGTASKSSRRAKLDRRTSPLSDYSASTSSSATSSSSRGEEEEEEEIVKPLKKRRIERVQDSDGSGHREERRGHVVRRPIRAVSGTPMPERKTLEEILDKLQKKDAYGVFAEPVDPEELPDYHDVIEHPMDFGTVRRKLATGRYRSFEQFEDDVFLICSNAMQYNAPDTIYFRQACSIQDVARRNFQEVRADLIPNGAERESEENIKSASNEKNTVKKLQCGIAPRPSVFDISSEKKTLRQPCRDTLDPLRCEISSMERKTLKKQYRTTPDLQGSNISSMERKTLKKPQHRTAPEPPGCDISSMEKKILKNPQYRTAPESRGSDFSSMEKKTIKKLQNRTVPKPQGSDVSSMEKETIKMLQNRTAPEPRDSDVSSMEKKTIKKLQNRTAPEPRGSDVSSMEKKPIKKPQVGTTPKPPDSDISSNEKKTVKKPQCRTTPEPLGSDISSIEKTTVKKPHHRTEPEPLCSDISSQDKKTQKEHQSRTAPESLGSDNSSSATLASVADAFTGLSKKPTDCNASATDPCTGFITAQPNWITSAAEPCFGLTTGKAGGIEGAVTINGFVDGNSSLGESKSEKVDEVPAKGSPSKIAMKPFVVDMNRRATYTLDEQPVVETDSVFDVFEGETRQLVAVGLSSEYSYARSLARFAASLGPIAWEIASKKIKQALPPGVKFGPGWVGEYEPLLTPVLSIKNNMQQQPAVTRKDKGNEIKSEAISTISRKDKGNEITSEVSNGQHKDLPFGLKSQMTAGRPSSKASNSLHEGRDRTQEQKQGPFGVNLERHPCTSRMTLQQQKNQPAGDLARAYTNETTGHRLDICSEVAKSTPAIISHGWNHVQTEVQKLQQQNNQVAQMQVETQKQLQKKNKVAADFPKAHTNETTRQRPDLYSEARTANFPATSYLGRSQVQTEPLRQPEAVTSERRHDGLGMNIGGLNNWKSCDSRQNSPFGIISNHQAGVQYWHARGSQEQAVNDPLRWMSSSGKLSNQPNASNRCSNNLEQSVPTVQIPKRENPNAAAAQAWMSIGASAEWKSVDGGGLPSKQVGSASFNPIWKTPSPASRAHEEANIRPEALQGVTENSQVHTKGLVIFPQLMTTDLSRLRSPWQGLVQHNNKQKDSLPPDLNISFQPPGSPARSSSGILIDSQQPDLALQL